MALPGLGGQDTCNTRGKGMSVTFIPLQLFLLYKLDKITTTVLSRRVVFSRKERVRKETLRLSGESGRCPFGLLEARPSTLSASSWNSGELSRRAV